MTENKVAAIGFGAINGLIVTKNILRVRAFTIGVVNPSVAAGNLHFQSARDYLPVVAIIKPSQAFSVIIRLELATLQPSPAILTGLRHQRRSGQRFTKIPSE